MRADNGQLGASLSICESLTYIEEKAQLRGKVKHPKEGERVLHVKAVVRSVPKTDSTPHEVLAAHSYLWYGSEYQ